MQAETAAGDIKAGLLELDEAVRLCHVLVAHAAATVGVRVFFIKGPASGEMGLRPPKVSIDVDAFVSPVDMPVLLRELESRGWRTRPRADELVGFPHHSNTLFNETWPNNIDVHFRFPGMELPADACFEVLWAETQDFVMANHAIRVPTLELGVVIMALHALRTPGEAAEQQALEFLVSLPLEPHMGSIVRIAQSCRSMAALRPFLEAAGAAIPEWPRPSPDWQNLTTVEAAGSGWAVALAAAPWRKRPKLLYSAMFPSTEALRGANLYADLSFKGRFQARASRWRTFCRQIPSLVDNLRDIRRNRLEP